MGEALGIARLALVGLLIVGVCVQLAVVLRNRYVRVEADEERDEESFDAELELQLQGELDQAIKSSTPLLTPEKGTQSLVSTAHVRFVDESSYESSWTIFKRESRAKLEQFAKTLRILSKDDSLTEESSSDASDENIQVALDAHHQRSFRRQLPLLDSDGALAEKGVLVNAKQYNRILKRRLARQLIEEYFRTQSKPSSPKLPQAGSMRRPRGPDGRFLTTAEIRRVEAGLSGSGKLVA